MSAQKRSKFHGLFGESSENPAEQPAVVESSVNVGSDEAGRKQETKKPREEASTSRNEERKKSRNQEGSEIARTKTNYEIRDDYVLAMKRLAVDERRKIYEVLEAAIEEYLKKKGRL
ncbi:MAG: hypothetical protein M3R24_05755 [Chloroflexota bacterium]|nr:hypothetical protein [Chloroflexota bacterium]